MRVPQSLEDGLDRVRRAILDPDGLVRAVAAGRRRGSPPPPFRRVELRYVDLKRGRHLQITQYDEQRSYIHNVDEAGALEAVDALLTSDYANWHVQSQQAVLQLRVTKRGEAQVHERAVPATDARVASAAHDRSKPRVLPSDHPMWRIIGLADAQGQIMPSKTRKYRQVEEFLALLGPRVEELFASGTVAEPTVAHPLRVVDLGCGNAYLTFAAYAYLSSVRGWPTRVCGVDVRPDSRDRNVRKAQELGWLPEMTFVAAVNADADVDTVLGGPPDVVLSLHACDTATDEALTRAVRWNAPLILAAPCCHHDIQRQLRSGATPEPYDAVTRHGILRERLADVLTDTFRASLLSVQGYRVDVVQFVESQHTPRNTMLRAVRMADAGTQRGRPAETARYVALRDSWGVTPALETMLDLKLGSVLSDIT